MLSLGGEQLSHGEYLSKHHNWTFIVVSGQNDSEQHVHSTHFLDYKTLFL